MADCTIIDKLNYILETKDLIKTAIETQDVEVLESDTFRKYSEYITEIRKVASVNGETGDIVLKTINGQNLVGEGNIIIQGGEGGSATAGVNKLILGEEDYGWNAYQGDIKLKGGFMQFDEGDVGFDIGVSGTDAYGGESGSMWFGFRSTDDSLLIEDAGGRIDLKVNPDILGGGGSATETDPIFTEWKNGESIALGKDSTNEGSNNIAIGNTVKANGEGSIAIGAATIYDEGTEYEDIYPTEANGEGSIAIGNETIANNASLTIGSYNNINNASVALGMWNTITSDNSLAVGNNNSLEGGSFKFAYGFFNEPKNNQEINIGVLCKSRTGNTDSERTHFVISSYNNRNGEDNTSCFEIRNDDSIYIKMDGQLVKLQDKLNINIPETDLSDYYTKSEVNNLIPDVSGYLTESNLKTINGVSIVGDGNITIEGGGSEPEQYVKMLGEEYNNNLIWYMNQSNDYREIKFKTINGNAIMGEGNITIEGGGGSTAGVEAINIGREVQDWTQKTGIVSMYTDWYDGSYDVGIGGTSFFGIKPIDNSIILEYAGGTVNGNSRCGIKINTDNFKTINGESILGEGNITINGGGSSGDGQGLVDIFVNNGKLIGMEENGNWRNEVPFKTINGQTIIGEEGNIEIEGGSGSVKVVELTQAEYDALTSYDDDTFYVITDADKQYVIQSDLSNYYTKSEIDAILGNVSSKITEINNLI